MSETSAALVVVDMLNRYDHEDAEPLKESARAVVPTIARLVAQAREGAAHMVYVNDNHGNWGAGRRALAEWALEGAEPELVRPIVPQSGTPFLVKARHSIFYATQLEYMLRQQGVDHVVLAGQVTEQCILYSALDAYIRHFRVTIPRDAVAHIRSDLADAALEMMASNMRADIVDAGAALQVLTG